MFSKYPRLRTPIRVFVLILLAQLLLGCGIKFNEAPPKLNPVGFGTSQYECVGQVPSHLRLYLDAKISVERMRSFSVCLQGALTNFLQLTRGKAQEHYSAQEIRQFLETYFLDGRHVSDGLLEEAMRLKQLLLGGKADRVSRTELNQAIERIAKIEELLVRLHPFIPMLNPAQSDARFTSRRRQQLRQATAMLSTTAKAFANLLSPSLTEYPIQALTRLLHELRSFDRNPSLTYMDATQLSEWAQGWGQLLQSYKSIIQSTKRAEVIEPSDWLPLFTEAAELYSIRLSLRLLSAANEWRSLGALADAELSTRRMLKLVERAIRSHSASVIEFSEIDNLILALQKTKLLTVTPSAATIGKVVRSAVTQMLGDASVQPDLRQAKGLGLAEVQVLRQEVGRWLSIQNRINQEFTKDLRHDSKSGGAKDWQSFLEVRQRLRPLLTDSAPEATSIGRVVVANSTELQGLGVTHGYANLTHMNFIYSLVALVYRGYAEAGGSSEDFWSRRIQSAELQRFFVDFRSLGVELKSIDPRSDNVGSRSFLEGNLFTYAADGSSDSLSGTLSSAEGIELIASLMSGSKVSSSLYADLSVKCHPKALEAAQTGRPLDPSGEPMVDRKCVMQRLGEVLVPTLSHMPGLQRYLRSISVDERQAYVEELLSAAFSKGRSELNWVEHSELSTLAMLTHYAEVIFTRFDLSNNDQLDAEEIQAASTHFLGIIKVVAKQKVKIPISDSLARGVLYFILKYKRVPGFVDVPWVYKFSVAPPRLELSRLDLLESFRSIVERVVNAD